MSIQAGVLKIEACNHYPVPGACVKNSARCREVKSAVTDTAFAKFLLEN